MIERQLQLQLDKVATRFRQLRLCVSLTVAWSIFACVGYLILAMNYRSVFYLHHALILIGGLALLATSLCLWLAWQSARDYHWIAQKIEQAYPELDSCLLAAVDQQPQLPSGRFGFMQESVIRQSMHHGYVRRWRKVVPNWQLGLAFGSNLLALCVLSIVMTGLAFLSPPTANLNGIASTDEPSVTTMQFSVTIDPGNAEVERGTSLLVMARFTGELPPEATLIYETADGETSQLEMSQSLRDPVFGGRIPSVNEPLSYQVKYAEQNSQQYKVTVFEYPRLQRADANLSFPKYTSLDERLVQDVRQVSAVEGTQLTLLCYLNKAVANAQLVGRDGSTFELKPDAKEANLYTVEMTLEKSRRFELRLVDDQGRSNKQPPEFVINVLPNKPPELKLVMPSRDVQVSPIEELQLKANAWDDFGLNGIGVTYAIPGKDSNDIVLATHTEGKKNIEIEHLVAFEKLKAEPDQLLAYHFWAEDTGPDGTLRRVSSDMYFAEVRHFEEIFRQGQQPPGGQQQQQQNQGNAQQAQQLAELQKQIINATWAIIRRETGETPSDQFPADTQLLVDSQQTALEQGTELAEKLDDAQSKQHIAEVIDHMQLAIERLSEAKAGPTLDQLQPAMAPEQAAYQALLKLRARAHEVVQSNQQQQQSSSSSSQANRSQQQLQQLELKNDENRYEQQRTALPEENQQQRETRQVLNRLRELARRQSDLNERIKELQSALEEAQTEEEKEEIKRQLQRLREEQQQILRDTDELKSRMDQPENQQQMAEEGKQLEQTRENIRQTSEALKEGMVSQAAASGERAEQKFEELREEFRKRASGRFNEEMKEMREQAQELEQKEGELADALAELNNPNRENKSLRDGNRNEQVKREFIEQEKKLDSLLERMRQTVEDAEQSEPLLAEQLYDTYRNAEHQNVRQTLDATRRSLERGLLEDAENLERVASRGINELREGIERAAESVLGDETEALQRAQEELKDLSDELKEEVDRADPMEASGQSPSKELQPSGNQDQQRGSSPESQKEGNQEKPSESQSSDQPQDQQNSPPQNESQSPQLGGGQPNSQSQSEQEAHDSQGQQPGQSSQSEGTPNQSKARSASANGLGGLEQLLNDTTRSFAPLSGGDYLQWSDRLRDVEEMLEDPELRAEAARIRDRARGIRQESKRYAKPPNWDLVRLQVLDPLVELSNRVNEELLKRSSKDATVPIDRDPVPPKYAEQVRRYYERLGSGK